MFVLCTALPLMQTGGVSLTTFYKKTVFRAFWVSISKAVQHKAPSQGRAQAAMCSQGQLWDGCALLASLADLSLPVQPVQGRQQLKRKSSCVKNIPMLTAESRAESYRELLSRLQRFSHVPS